ncbi:MAG: hypothetical protein ABIT06_05765 [Saprospiraceae bacterium]
MLFEDKDFNLWIATRNGLIHLAHLERYLPGFLPTLGIQHHSGELNLSTDAS